MNEIISLHKKYEYESILANVYSILYSNYSDTSSPETMDYQKAMQSLDSLFHYANKQSDFSHIRIYYSIKSDINFTENKYYEALKNAEKAVLMTQKPTDALRNGNGTSMLSSIESVKDNHANAAVSCGNTGALMLMSLVKLRKISGVNRPAIAVLWPSRNPSGFNILLDAGADVKADTQDLLKYAIMGATYAQNGFNISLPRVGLLNVGTEEIKGSKHLYNANEEIKVASKNYNFNY